MLARSKKKETYLFSAYDLNRLNELTDLIKEDNEEKKDNYYRRGILYSSLRNYSKALSDFNAAIDLFGLMHPFTTTILLERSRANLKCENMESALDDINQVIERDPTRQEAYYLQSKILRRQKRFTEAVRSLFTAIFAGFLVRFKHFSRYSEDTIQAELLNMPEQDSSSLIQQFLDQNTKFAKFCQRNYSVKEMAIVQKEINYFQLRKHGIQVLFPPVSFEHDKPNKVDMPAQHLQAEEFDLVEDICCGINFC